MLKHTMYEENYDQYRPKPPPLLPSSDLLFQVPQPTKNSASQWPPFCVLDCFLNIIFYQAPNDVALLEFNVSMYVSQSSS